MDACVVDVTSEFLGVAFHNILYYASVYPKSVFVTVKKYGVVVYQCVHPEVNYYIDRCLESIAEALKTNELQRVEFAVTDYCFKPGLKFVFNFDRLPVDPNTQDSYLVRCEQNFREFCLLLTEVSYKFNGFPADCTFGICLYTYESMGVALANLLRLEDFPLVEVDEEEVEEQGNILPLRRLAIRNLFIDTYIELPKPWSFCS